MQKVVVMTAIAVERQAILSYLKDVYEDIHLTGTIYNRGIFFGEKGSWEVAVVRMGVGNVMTAQAAQQAIDYLSPDLILFVGVAGGLKDVSPGDVVVATKIYQYTSGKAGVDFFPRPEVRLSTHRLVQRAQVVAESEQWQQRIRPLPPTKLPSAYVGAIAAGEQVLSSTDSETWKLLNKYYSDALAVEMEGYGVLAAASVYQGLEAIVIRGISDTLDNKVHLDKQGFQYAAAHHACAFAFEMLAKLGMTQNSMKEVTLSERTKDSLHFANRTEEREKNTIIINGSIGKGSAVGSNPFVYNYSDEPIDNANV
jgi:nucleoside phosphorylase